MSFLFLRTALIAILLGYVPFGLAQGTRPSNQPIVSSISSALRNHEFGRALQMSGAALQRSPEDNRLWTLRALAYSGVGKPKLALESFQRALKISPDYLPALEGAAQLQYLHPSGDAKTLVEHILLLRPEDPTGHAMLGTIDYEQNDCEGAVDHFQRAVVLIANEPESLTEYGACLANLNRFSEAIPIFQRVVGLEPDKAPAVYNLALVEWKSNRADDAIKVLDPMIQIPDADESIFILAADIHESKSDTQKAIDLLRKAIQAHPKDRAAYLDFANLSVNHASVKVGIDVLNLGIAQLPKQAELYLVRGVLYCELGDTAAGMVDFETANRLDPKLSFPGIAEGLAESQSHKSDEALATFRIQARQHPDDALSQYLLAEALSERGKNEGDPEYREEVRAAALAVKLDPRLGAGHDLLATIYLRDGKTDLAIQHCQEALKIDADDQQALYHLILAMRKSGNKEELRALADRLIEVRNKNHAEAKPVQRFQIIDTQPTPSLEPPH